VEHARIDILAARAAGLPVAAVAWGFGSREDLRAVRPDRLVLDTDELVRLILD